MDASVLLPAGIPMLTLTPVQFSQEKIDEKKTPSSRTPTIGIEVFSGKLP